MACTVCAKITLCDVHTKLITLHDLSIYYVALSTYNTLIMYKYIAVFWYLALITVDSHSIKTTSAAYMRLIHHWTKGFFQTIIRVSDVATYT